MLWTALASLPFIIVVQRMAGRIGLISGKGLAGNLKRHYPHWILISVTLMIVLANIINIGADISGMAAALNLLVPFPPILLSALLSGAIIVLFIFASYRRIARYLKWVALSLVSYVLAVFLVHQNWTEILYRIVVPKFIFSKEYLAMLIALFGTTISPYLFFWQASEEVEEARLRQSLASGKVGMIPSVEPHGHHQSKELIKNEIGSMYQDVHSGMAFSQLIQAFIIILAASTFFRNGFTNISTVEEVAQIIKPLAGHYANLLFLIGITASGILAVPILAGTAAYALAEMFGWKEGLEHRFTNAKEFYLVMIFSTLLGLLIPVFHLSPVNILFYTALIFGAVSPFLVLVVIHMANNPKIMKEFTSRWWTNIIAYILFLILSVSVILMFYL